MDGLDKGLSYTYTLFLKYWHNLSFVINAQYKIIIGLNLYDYFTSSKANQMWRLESSDWKKIPEPVAKFILEQAKARLEETIVISDNITTSSLTILLVLITGVTSITGYVVSQLSASQASILIIFLSLIALILLISISVLSINVFPRRFENPGRKPSEIAQKNMLESNLDDNLKHLSFILNEIDSYQVKIEFNDGVNKKRLDRLRLVMYGLAYGFVTTIICTYLLLILSFLLTKTNS